MECWKDLASSELLEISQLNHPKQKQTESKYGQVIEYTWGCSSQNAKFVCSQRSNFQVFNSIKAMAKSKCPPSQPRDWTLASTEGKRAKSPLCHHCLPRPPPLLYPLHLNSFVPNLISEWKKIFQMWGNSLQNSELCCLWCVGGSVTCCRVVSISQHQTDVEAWKLCAD